MNNNYKKGNSENKAAHVENLHNKSKVLPLFLLLITTCMMAANTEAVETRPRWKIKLYEAIENKSPFDIRLVNELKAQGQYDTIVKTGYSTLYVNTDYICYEIADDPEVFYVTKREYYPDGTLKSREYCLAGFHKMISFGPFMYYDSNRKQAYNDIRKPVFFTADMEYYLDWLETINHIDLKTGKGKPVMKINAHVNPHEANHGVPRLDILTNWEIYVDNDDDRTIAIRIKTDDDTEKTFIFSRDSRTILRQSVNDFETTPEQFDYTTIKIGVKDNKAGVINSSGELIVPYEYDLIANEKSFLRNYWKIYKLLVPQQHLPGAFLNNPAASETIQFTPTVEGIIDRNGKIIIPCEYTTINGGYNYGQYIANYELYFKVHKYIASDKIHLHGIIDMNGKVIIPVKYAEISRDNFGRYILYSSPQGLAGLADNSGNIIIPTRYKNIASYSSEYIIVTQNGKYGIVTPRNKVLIRPKKYEEIDLDSAHNKLFFFARRNKKWGRINNKGKILLAPKYEDIMPYREKDDDSMVVLFEGQWMRVDSKGKVIERYEKYPYQFRSPK